MTPYNDGLTDAFYSDLLALEAERCAKNERQKRAGGEEYTYVTSADNQGRQSGAAAFAKTFGPGPISRHNSA